MQSYKLSFPDQRLPLCAEIVLLKALFHRSASLSLAECSPETLGF
ncbi:MAG: hypothetical protein U5R06_01555 [candidate division KSB1 bacterium]|nr:hypothetical protein [candidate division KSB1 bacterium]